MFDVIVNPKLKRISNGCAFFFWVPPERRPSERRPPERRPPERRPSERRPPERRPPERRPPERRPSERRPPPQQHTTKYYLYTNKIFETKGMV